MFSRSLRCSGTSGVFKSLQQNLLNSQGSMQLRLFMDNPSTYKYYRPRNTVILFVPQQEAWVVERMGKFHKILNPGLNLAIPIIDKVKYVQSLKEMAMDIPKQSAITADNVTLNIDGVLYLRVNDPYLASYGVEDPEFAVMQLAQTTMRSEIGKMALDSVFREREELNTNIVASFNKASGAWGMTCLRYEIRDIKLPNRVHEAMQMQVEAERKKRAAILESEGIRQAEINVAEGKRLARILTSEAMKQEQINNASGEATAIITVAEARAKGLQTVASMLRGAKAPDAAALVIAEQYVKAFGNLAKTNNTMILPSNMADVASFIAQALSVQKHLAPKPSLASEEIQGNNDYETIIAEGSAQNDFAKAYKDLSNRVENQDGTHSEKQTKNASG